MPKASPAPAPAPAGRNCPSCGAAAESSSAFCTGCGQRLPASADAATVVAPVAEPTVVAIPVPASEPVPAPAASVAEQVSAAPAGVAAFSSEAAAVQPAIEPVSQPPSVPASYPPAQQPAGSKFGLIVFILLVVIVGAGFGGWYFWGVETIVVCSPPDVRVFLDDQELTATSYGRYVIPHLSRKSHLLKVQSAGFADTVQRLDFPITTSREWVNIRLVRSRDVQR